MLFIVTRNFSPVCTIQNVEKIVFVLRAPDGCGQILTIYLECPLKK